MAEGVWHRTATNAMFVDDQEMPVKVWFGLLHVMQEKTYLKVVLLGKVNSGKTCLVTRYITRTFSEETPSVSQAFVRTEISIFLEEWRRDIHIASISRSLCVCVCVLDMKLATNSAPKGSGLRTFFIVNERTVYEREIPNPHQIFLIHTFIPRSAFSVALSLKEARNLNIYCCEDGQPAVALSYVIFHLGHLMWSNSESSLQYAPYGP